MFWSSIQSFGTQGVSFVISIVLARLLLPEEFGLIAMITVFMGIGNTLLNAGLGQSLIRTKDPTEEDYSTVFFFNLLASIVVYMLIYFSAPWNIDLAPTILVTDTLLVAHLADATICAVRASYTDKKLIPFSVELSKTKRLLNMSYVINGVKENGSYGYNYNYGYNYGYGDEES